MGRSFSLLLKSSYCSYPQFVNIHFRFTWILKRIYTYLFKQIRENPFVIRENQLPRIGSLDKLRYNGINN